MWLASCIWGPMEEIRMQISKQIVTLFLLPAFLISTQAFAQQSRVVDSLVN